MIDKIQSQERHNRNPFKIFFFPFFGFSWSIQYQYFIIIDRDRIMDLLLEDVLSIKKGKSSISSAENIEKVHEDQIRMNIDRCSQKDFNEIHAIINQAAQAYKGVIPKDCWEEPYMPKEELGNEINDGVTFWGYWNQKTLDGVMGLQQIQDVSLIRHAYVKPSLQNQGIGGHLLLFLLKQTDRPILVGTWQKAIWAVSFYEKHGFRLVSPSEKDRLLKKYWKISERQIETSVVLADQKWFNRQKDLEGASA